MSLPSFSSSNRILSRLSARHIELLSPHLRPVDTPLRMHLETAGKAISHVYFMESGMASVTITGNKQTIEVGIIGREGMTGLAVLLFADKTPQDTFVQIAGSAQRIEVKKFREALGKDVELHRIFLRYAHAFTIQTAQTSLANGRRKLEDRLSRWLVMAQDRVDGDDVPLTHEFLSVMLGVRRAGVTEGLKLLSQQGLIRAGRGKITILDREKLLKRAYGAYGASEAEFERLSDQQTQIRAAIGGSHLIEVRLDGAVLTICSACDGGY